MCGQRWCCGANGVVVVELSPRNGTIIAFRQQIRPILLAFLPKKEVLGMKATQLTSWACTRATGPCFVARFSKLLKTFNIFENRKTKEQQMEEQMDKRMCQNPGRIDSAFTSLVMIALHYKFGQILTQQNERT